MAAVVGIELVRAVVGVRVEGRVRSMGVRKAVGAGIGVGLRLGVEVDKVQW